MVKNPPAMWETWVHSLGLEDPLEEGMATHSSILAWRNPHGQRSLVGYSPWGRKESDTTEWLSTAQKWNRGPPRRRAVSPSDFSLYLPTPDGPSAVVTKQASCSTCHFHALPRRLPSVLTVTSWEGHIFNMERMRWEGRSGLHDMATPNLAP